MQNVHKTRIFIHLTFFTPSLAGSVFYLTFAAQSRFSGVPQRSVSPLAWESGIPCLKRQYPYESTQRIPQREAFSESRLHLFERRHPRALLGQPRPAATPRLHRCHQRMWLRARVLQPLSGVPTHRKTQPRCTPRAPDYFCASR